MKKAIGAIFGFIKFILWVFIIALLAVVLTQRVTNNEKGFLGIRIFTVVTESMVPKYNVGDAILVKEVLPEDLKVGDDITYLGKEESFKDKYITHQIIEIEKKDDGKYRIVTKGIANEDKDPEIDDTQVFGRVLYKTKIISYFNGVVGNLYSMYFVVVVPMAIMIFFEFRAFRKDDNFDDDDEDDRKEKRKKEKNDKDEDEKDIEEEQEEDNEKEIEEKDETRNERRKRRRHKRRNR